MSRKVIISTIQLPTPNYSKEVSIGIMRKKNIEVACKWLEMAGKKNSDIVCLVVCNIN